MERQADAGAPPSPLHLHARPGRVLQGTLTRSAFQSRCLEGSLLGEPTDRDVLVYTPPSYDPNGTRLPLVLLLPAFGSTHLSAAGYSPWKENTFERLERQILRGECPPCILALPDVMTRFGGGQYVDSKAAGRWQTYLAEEVLPHLDAHFHTIPEASGRAVVGRSSGGFGALRLAMDRPGLVSAVASHAGDAHFEVSMKPMLTHAAVAFHAAGGLEAFAAKMDETGPKGGLDFDGLFVLGCSVAYASDETAFPYCELPMDAQGNLREGAWGKWLAHDPVLRIPEHAGALRQLREVFVDAGDADEHGLQFAAKALADALKAVSAPVHFEEHPGGHRGTSWRYEVSLPRLVKGLT